VYKLNVYYCDFGNFEFVDVYGCSSKIGEGMLSRFMSLCFFQVKSWWLWLCLSMFWVKI